MNNYSIDEIKLMFPDNWKYPGNQKYMTLNKKHGFRSVHLDYIFEKCSFRSEINYLIEYISLQEAKKFYKKYWVLGNFE